MKDIIISAVLMVACYFMFCYGIVYRVDKVSKWWEHNAEADLAYADTKLSELARELAPDEPILIGQAYDIFDDKKDGESGAGKNDKA
ncbi:MAG: hypothetical protein E7432_04265 [Ruminococcaceae bacterium]|nr:hypothetical protein [Oscillospiraceae bacterium]